MSWALRYEGELTAVEAEEALRAALPGLELVRKTATVFAVSAPPERSLVPSGWLLYQPAVADVAPPALKGAQIRKRLGK
jgi:hypothetical protein